MDVGAFITAISIFVAVYAIVPRATRLQLSLKVTLPDAIALLLILCALHHFLFFDMFNRYGISHRYFEGMSQEYRESIAYFIFLGFLIFLIFRFKYLPIPKNNLPKMHKLVEELLADKNKHPQLIELMGANAARLKQISGEESIYLKSRNYMDKQNPNLPKIADLISGLGQNAEDRSPSFQFPILQKENAPFFSHTIRLIFNTQIPEEQSIYPLLQKKNIRAIKHGFKLTASRFLQLFPYSDKHVGRAKDLLDQTFSNRSFVESIATINPYYALQIYSLDADVSYVFSDLYIASLLRSKESALYAELKNNTNLADNNDYEIPVRNRLLGFLFLDAQNAERFGVWRPIGEEVILDLEARKMSSKKDEYNYPLQENESEGYWDSTLYAGVAFFDLMIRKAITQNICWHMWIYYFYYFTERICDNFKAESFDEDYVGEFPTRYTYLLSRIFYSLRDCVLILENINLNQDNLLLSADDNGNPVKSSIIVMSSCLFQVSTCGEMPDRMKRYFFEISLDLYMSLKSSNKTAAYADYMFRRLINGGNWDRKDKRYLGNLLSAITCQDNLRYETEHVDRAISKITHEFVDAWGFEALADYVDAYMEDNQLVIIFNGRRYQIQL